MRRGKAKCGPRVETWVIVGTAIDGKMQIQARCGADSFESAYPCQRLSSAGALARYVASTVYGSLRSFVAVDSIKGARTVRATLEVGA